MRRCSQPWFFVSLVTLAIAISYFDRQALPVAISAIERTLPISDAHSAVLQASFLASYALLYAGGGKFLDVIGTRAGFAISMAWWSLACALHGSGMAWACWCWHACCWAWARERLFPQLPGSLQSGCPQPNAPLPWELSMPGQRWIPCWPHSDRADSPGRKLALCLLLCRLPCHRLGHRLGGDIPATSEDRIRQSYGNTASTPWLKLLSSGKVISMVDIVGNHRLFQPPQIEWLEQRQHRSGLLLKKHGHPRAHQLSDSSHIRAWRQLFAMPPRPITPDSTTEPRSRNRDLGHPATAR